MPSEQAAGINSMQMGVTATVSSGNGRQNLINNLQNNLPTIVTVSWKDLSIYGHALLVVSYCPSTNQFTFMDPATGTVIEEKDFFKTFPFDGSTFNQAWLNQPNTGIPSGSMVTLSLEPNNTPGSSYGGGGYGGASAGMLASMAHPN